MPSRRETNKEMTTPQLLENLQAVFPYFLTAAPGYLVPLLSIFLKNTKELETIENDEEWKQDCELKAFRRLRSG
jgi:hypothetical protein